MSKYGVFSGSHIPVFGPNAGKHGPEKTPYLNNFHVVRLKTNKIKDRCSLIVTNQVKDGYDQPKSGLHND